LDDVFNYTNYRPGLAFVPFDKSVDATVGRFYWAYNFPDDGIGRMAFTEGNDSSGGATSRRLGLMAYRHFPLFEHTQGGMSLLYDPLRDDNLRLTYSHRAGSSYRTVFLPIADGIINGKLTDQNDYPVLTNNLRMSLGYSTPPAIQ
jgi:hypothetical protein